MSIQPKPILSFKGTPLSNFHRHEMEYDGQVYPTMEHFFQAMKTRDSRMRILIANQLTAGDAKREGNRVKLREDWEHIKLGVMRHGLSLKFSPGSAPAVFLLGTGDRMLVEGNVWRDQFWGVTQDGKGENWLGWLLMAQRAYLRGSA